MIEKGKLRKADLVFSVILMLFGAFALVEALKMPHSGLAGTGEGGAYTSPGFLPALISVALMGMGLMLMIHALRHGGKISGDDIAVVAKSLRSRESIRAALIALIILGYVFGLLGRIPFIFATFIYLLVFMLTFRATVWWKAVLICAVTSIVIAYSFGTLARIPLP